MKNIRLGFLASHNGSNIQAIIDACKSKTLNAVPAVIISNNSDSGALQKAKQEHIPYYHLSSKTHNNPDDLDKAILGKLIEHKTDIVILAGYMKKLGKNVLNHYKSKILNIHPALLPEYGGQGMYGLNVHKAVLEAKEKETGVTIHVVDNNYDTGKIINQCKVPVLGNDSIESLRNRVLEREHTFFVETLQKITEGKIKL